MIYRASAEHFRAAGPFAVPGRRDHPDLREARGHPVRLVHHANRCGIPGRHANLDAHLFRPILRAARQVREKSCVALHAVGQSCSPPALTLPVIFAAIFPAREA